MQLNNNLFTKKVNNTYSLIYLVLPLFINIIAIVLSVLNNWVITEHNVSFLNIIGLGIPLLGGSYFVILAYYIPPIILIRFLRGQKERVIINSVTITLWSFSVLALILILFSTVSMLFTPIPWSYFANALIWGKFIIIPIALTVIYGKFSNESFLDGLIDSMVVCIIVWATKFI